MIFDRRHDEPTKEDLARAAVGVSVILRLADLHRDGGEEVWQPIPSSERAAVEIDGVNCGLSHAEPEQHTAAP